MPDFDKDLIAPVNLPNQIDREPQVKAYTPAELSAGGSNYAQTEDIFGKLNAASRNSKYDRMGAFATNEELAANKRYATYNPTIENQEDFAAYGQSGIDKAVNGTLKGLGLAATTVAGGFGMLYGVAKSPFSGRLADIWDNEVMRGLDDINTKVDNEILPNYYTDREKNANWYSTDNWFKTNFLFDKLIKNSGFAVGAMVSGNIANGFLRAAGASIGSLAAEGAVLSEGSQAFKLFTPLLRNTARAFSAGKNLEAAAILDATVTNIADVTAKSSRLASLAKTTNAFAKFGDASRRTAIALYSSAGEASFEALQTAKEYRNALIEDHKKNYGEEPMGQDLDKINQLSESVGKASFLGNLALLGATEFTQLPHILGSSYAASRSTANSLVGEVADITIKDGAYIAAKSTTKFGKLYDKVTGVGRYIFDPKEAAQENLQYALQVGSQNYYNKAYRTNDGGSLVDSMLYGLFGKNEEGEGVGSFVSKEGMEGTLLGGITGGLMQARSTYVGQKQINRNTEAFLQEIGPATEFKEAFIDKMNSNNRAIVLQQEEQKATLQGDKLEAMDLRSDQMHNYLATRIKYGRFDMVMDDISELRKDGATTEGLASLKEQGLANVNDNIQSYAERLNKFEQVAKNTDQIYRSINMRYSGQTSEDGSKKYSKEAVDKMVYAASKVANYDLRIPQVNEALVAAGINTQEILDEIHNLGKTNRQATKKALKELNQKANDQIDDLDTIDADELKGNLSDVIEMALRRKLYLKDFNDIKEDPEKYDLEGDQQEEKGTVRVKQFAEVDGKQKTVGLDVEVGKEYSLAQPIRRDGNALSLAPKLTVLSKTLGGEYEVRTPNGEVTFLKPEQFKNYEISDVDNTSEGINNILMNAINTVARRAKYKGLGIDKAENKLDFVNSLDNAELMNDIQAVFDGKASEFLKDLAVEQAKKNNIITNSVELEEQQEDLDEDAGDTVTENDEDSSFDWEDMKKMFSRLFTSTTTASAAWEKEKGRDLAPHIVRYNQFINDFKKFKNKANIRIVLVTAKQQAALGLNNLAETSLPADQRANMNSVSDGFIGAVFVEQDNGSLYPVDKNGKRITDTNGNDVALGKPSAGLDINKVVFSTMPTTDLYYSKPLKSGKPNPRYRAGEEKDAENQSALWKNYREGLFSTEYKSGDAIPSFNFGISRGIAMKTDKTQNNPASVVFGLNVDPKSVNNIIATNKGLITVSTLGKVAHADGNSYKFAKGRPVLKYDDVLEYLNNSAFSKSQAKAIFNVIKMLSDTITSDIVSNKKLQLKNKYTQFLQNVLYFSKKGAQSANKVSIDYATATLTIGNEKFDFANIGKEETRMVEHLQTVFSNVNNATLTKNFNDPFYEFLEDGTERKWANYQSYLLSGTTPDGKARTDIPLTVNVTAPTESVPYAYEQKYAFLTDIKFAESAPTEAAPTATAEGVEYAPEGTFDTKAEKVNRIKLNNGEFEFTYNAEEAVPVKFTKVADDAVFNYIDKKLTDEKNNPNQTARFTTLSENERVSQALGDFAAVITNKVQQSLEAPAPKVEAAEKAAETAPVPEMAPASPEPIQAPASAPIKTSPKGTLTNFSILGENNRFDPVNAKPVRDKKTYYGVDQEGDVFMIPEESRLPIMINDSRDYIDRLYSVTLPDGMRMEQRKGVTITALPKVDSQGNLINKGKLTYTYEPTIKYSAKQESSVVNQVTRKKRNVSANSGEFENFRRVGATEEAKITDADLEEFKKWHAKNAAGIPYEVLENIVKTHDNKKAWGVFEDGIAKFFRGAIRGTEYHEVFEGIFKGFLTESQQRALLDEFKSKKGEFTDRATGKKIRFEDATDLEAKERIADDFSDFRLGKLPARTLSAKIARFFKAIVDFFKGFVTKPSLKDSLFKDIDTGKFAERTFPVAKVNDAPEYRLIEGLDSQEVYEFTDDIVGKFMYITTSNNKSLFNISGKSYDNFFTQVIDNYKKNPDNDDINDDQYELLILSAKDKLNSLGFGFDEDNIVTVNDENSNNRLYAAEAFTTDFKKSSPYAIKLISASLPKTTGVPSKDPLTAPALKYSSTIGGQQLIPYNQVYATLSNKLQGIRNVNKLIKELYDLAKDNTDYVRLFVRLGGSMDTGKIVMSTTDQYRLFTQFMQTYTKVKPTMLVEYVNSNEVTSGEPNLASAAKQVEDSWMNNIIINADREGSSIIYNPGSKEYILKPGSYPTELLEDKIKLLNSLGVPFTMSTYNKLKTDDQRKTFGDSVEGLRADLVNANRGVITLKKTGKAKTIGTRLKTLAELYAKVEMPNLANTLYNPEGKMQQTSTESNAPSLLEYLFNSANTLDELKKTMPQIQDVFSANSQIFKLGGRFFDVEGNRIKSNPLNVRVILGKVDVNNNEGESMSKLTDGERYTTEINQNIKGNYYVLIPADGSTEWMMNIGNNVAFSQFMTGRGFDDVFEIYRGYLLDDIALAQDADNRSKIKNVGNRAKELRFFNDILSGELLDKMNSFVESKATSEEIQAYLSETKEGEEETNGQKVDNAVREFIENMRNKTISNLKKSKEIFSDADGTFNYAGLDSTFADDNNLNKNKLTEDELNMIIDFINSNYTMNNIEYHKILFGDPFQFKTEDGKLDETKRIKSFLSPRRITVDYDELNNFLNEEYNQVYGIQLTEKDPGYHLHKSYAKTLTAEDVNIKAGLGSIKPAYLKTNEADAASWISPTAYREVKTKNGQWAQEGEDFHQWQMAYARQKLSDKGKYVYTNTQLEKHDIALLDKNKTAPKYIIEILKSVVSGIQGNVGNNMKMVLDKFSQMPIYYQAVENTNLEELFLKMFDGGYDYVVVESGRKVGATSLHPLYKDGKFNDDAFNNTIDVPWSSYGIQVENSYDKPKDQPMGSQLTKVGTLDIYENGKARVKGAQEAYNKHKNALEMLYRNGYDRLTRELGIKDEGDHFSADTNKVASILRDEMLRRELSNNAISSVIIDPTSGKFIVPIEASTNYVQIKDILYGMVTNNISAPKMNGFSAVQAPVTMWEKSGKGRRIVRQVEGGGYEEISREEYDSLPDDEKPNVYLTDDTLKFYTKKEPWCEILISFPEESRKLFPGMTDEEIIKKLNATDPKALAGIGFRIPTAELSAVESFRIKGFLPSFMGATVIVPSAITTKAGSDFDIDKLNMYLRSLYKDAQGNVQSYKLQGDEAETKQFYSDIYDALETKPVDDKEEFLNDAYRYALENNYYDAIDDVLSLEGQFDRLTKPNTNKNLITISGDLNNLRGQNESVIKNRMLDRNYLTNLRQAFLMAKAWVGIGAVNITGHSNTQKVLTTIRENFKISLDHNYYDGKVSFSGVLDSENNYISDNLSEYINAFVDVAKDPYILDNIYSDQIVGIFMMLARAGVSPKQAALFMNQPIIREFVQNTDANKDYLSSSMFNEEFIELVQASFPTTSQALAAADGKINVAKLSKNISDYTTSSLDDEQNAQQHLILNEFFGYVKAASGLFKLTQATNYDTSRFKSSDELRRKELKATNKIKGQRSEFKVGDPEALLAATHIGVLKEVLNKSDNALSAILKFNSAPFRSLINNIIDPYAGNQYLSNDKFTRVSNKLTASLLDYIIQTNKDIFVPELTTGNSSIAVKYEEALAKFPESTILNALQVVPGKTKNAPVTIKLKVNTKDAFDENVYTDLMRGLRDNPDTADFYKSLVRISIAQGTYRTAVSIKNVIPIEDYADVVSNLVRNAEVDDNVINFQKNNWFQRNNFRDEAVAPRVVPMNYVNNNVAPRIGFTGDESYQYSIPSAISYWEAEEGKTAQKAILGIGVNSKGSGNDLIIVPRLLNVKGGVIVDYNNSHQISAKEYATEASKDVNKYDELYGYQKVKYNDGTPVIMKRSEKSSPEYVYKLVNLYGDGRYVSEYYKDTTMPSQLENGTVKPKEELTDEQIISHLGKMILKPIDNSEEAEVVAEPMPVAVPEKNIFEQRLNPINYTAGQTKALEEISKLIDTGGQGYYLLAGYAGTGKTTIAENIAKYAKSVGRNVVILAPTNKAAKVLNDKLKSTGTGTEAMTIHSAIYGEPDEFGEFMISKAVAPGTVLIIDESSMIDKEVMDDLMFALKKNNLLIFMGDGFQLEPVGENPGLFTGNVAQVKDNQTELTEVKRQALDSDILSVATLARTDNKAYVPSESTEDFKVVNTKREFLDDFTNSVKNNEDSVAIVATNNERIFLNNMARKAKFGADAKVMEDGETLIAVANSSAFSNSELFKIKSVQDEGTVHKIAFTFGNKTQSYDMHLMYVNLENGNTAKIMHFPDLDKPSLYHGQILKAIKDSNPALFDSLNNDQDIIYTRKGGAKLSKAISITTYGYALTAHKSQGSQWDKVFVYQNYNAPSWNAARWYYTAITRAANQVTVLPTENNVKLTPSDMENKLSNIVSNVPENVVSSQQTFEQLPIQQNFKDGDGGRKMQPQFANKSTMDLVLSGDRTRTTRAQTDINRMIKDYGLTKIEDLVGKIIPMSDKSGRVVQTRITKVVPFTQEYQDSTWQKEGWEKSVTDKLIGNYPYAIEFELVQSTEAPTQQTENWEEENNDCPTPF